MLLLIELADNALPCLLFPWWDCFTTLGSKLGGQREEEVWTSQSQTGPELSRKGAVNFFSRSADVPMTVMNGDEGQTT
jgi:hypothetical protein